MNSLPATGLRLLLAIAMLAALMSVAAVGGFAPAADAAVGDGYTPLVPARVLDTRFGVGAPQAKVGAATTIGVVVTGTGGVPAQGVAAVALNVTVTEPTVSSFLTVWPTGLKRPTASSLNMAAGRSVPNLVIAKVGLGGKVDMYNFAGETHIIADVVGWYAVGGDYAPLQPDRLLDTRAGLGAPAAKLDAGKSIDLKVAGRGGVPATGVGSVVVNITVTQPTAASFVTVWPTGEKRPNASNLNMVAGETFANLAIAKLGAGGKISLYNHLGSTNIVADVVGYHPAGSTQFVGLSPQRILDTRTGLGAAAAVVSGPGEITLDVTGRGGVPGTGVAAVVLNVTVTEATEASFITVWPSGATRPVASHLNMIAGQTVPNLVIAKVGTDGTVGIYNHLGATNVIADVVGYIPIPKAPVEPPPPEATKPSKVLAAKSTAGDAAVTVTWLAPADDGGSPVTGYLVTLEPGAVTKTVTGTSAVFTGLVNGTSYTATITPINGVGNGPVVSALPATPVAGTGTLLIGNTASEVPWLTAAPGETWDYAVDCGAIAMTINAAANSEVAFGPLPVGSACTVTQQGAVVYPAAGVPIGAALTPGRPGYYEVSPAHEQAVTIAAGSNPAAFTNTRWRGNGPDGVALQPAGCPLAGPGGGAGNQPWPYCDWTAVAVDTFVADSADMRYGFFEGKNVGAWGIVNFIDFSFAKAAGSNWSGFSGGGHTFEDADFSNAIFDGAVLTDAVGGGSTFNRANLASSSFVGTDIGAGTFVGADLSGANFSMAIRPAELTPANFTSANATNANFTGADLVGATLTGVTWSGATCPDGTLADADVVGPGTCDAHLAVGP